jgi:hypothetical protein
MEVPAHILDGQIEDVAIETLNPLMKREFASTSQVEGVQISTPPYKQHKGS